MSYPFIFLSRNGIESGFLHSVNLFIEILYIYIYKQIMIIEFCEKSLSYIYKSYSFIKTCLINLINRI